MFIPLTESQAYRGHAVLSTLVPHGYEITDRTAHARTPEAQLLTLLRGYGRGPCLVTADLDTDQDQVHQRMATEAESRQEDVDRIRGPGPAHPRPTWPVIVLRSPKGWTGPRTTDGVQVHGTWRSHQVPEVQQQVSHKGWSSWPGTS